VSLIGGLNYGSYKIDILKKIQNLNNKNESDIIKADLSKLLHFNDSSLSKVKFGILDKNKVIIYNQ
jgi:hypothetical protein